MAAEEGGAPPGIERNGPRQKRTGFLNSVSSSRLIASSMASSLPYSTTPPPRRSTSVKTTSPALRMWSFRSCQLAESGSPVIFTRNCDRRRSRGGERPRPPPPRGGERPPPRRPLPESFENSTCPPNPGGVSNTVVESRRRQ